MPVDVVQAEQGRRLSREGAFVLEGWHVLALFIAFFGVVGAVNAMMMTYALRTMPGLDARNGYDPSQRWNTEIRAVEAQDALGWRADAGVRLIDGRMQVSLQLANRDGRPVDMVYVEARLAHPSDRKRDLVMALDKVADGRHVGVAAGGSAGAWDLVIDVKSAIDGRTAWRSRQRVLIKD
jgi:nitrogen fixation protein FixH